MSDYDEKKCPSCGQKLRFPKNVGGIVMQCPSCGHRFESDFKIGTTYKHTQQNRFIYYFEMPSRFMDRVIKYFSS